MPSQLLEYADKNGIKVLFHSFQCRNLGGIYMSLPDCPPVIWISRDIKEHCLLRSVLAHELGHHHTSGKTTVSKTYLHFSDLINIGKEEYKAWRWAANFLIPDRVLREILSEDFREPWQLAEFFDVTEYLVQLKLKLYHTEGEKHA